MSCGKPCNCPDYRTHLRSISFQATGPHPVELKERQWHADMAAYKSMRRQGLQPKNIDGCAELQTRAHTQQEIEMGVLFPTKEMRDEARKGQETAYELFGEAS